MGRDPGPGEQVGAGRAAVEEVGVGGGRDLGEPGLADLGPAQRVALELGPRDGAVLDVAAVDLRGTVYLLESQRQRRVAGSSRIRSRRAGWPPTTALSGTSFVTTLSVPITQLSPTVTPRRMQAP